MKSLARFVAIPILTVGLSACGKYGPPVRWEPQAPAAKAADAAEAPEAKPQTVEEETLGPADFEDAGAEEENGP
jgi:hypothetical protein